MASPHCFAAQPDLEVSPSMTDPAHQRFWWLCLPEAIGLFLVGAATLVLGSLAIIGWSVERWAAGSHASVVGVASVAMLSLCAFAIATRGRRRALALLAVVVWVGLVACILAGYGISIPPGWWS